MKLALLGLVTAGLGAYGSQRAAAVPVAVSAIRFERHAPFVVANLSSLDLIPVNSSGSALANIPLQLKIGGETGDAQTVQITSDNTGVAHFNFTPGMAGHITYQAIADLNLNGVRDSGEAFAQDSTINIFPRNNLGSSLLGSGQVDFRGLFPDATGPVLGTFNMNIKTSAAGLASGNLSYSIPSRHLSGKSTSLDAVFGAQYSKMAAGAYVTGALRSGNNYNWFALTAVDNGGSTPDEFRLSLYNAPDQPSYYGGGSLIPRNGLRNQITYKLGTPRGYDELFVWPRKVDYGTVHPQQFYPKPIYLMNTWTSPLSARLDTSHLDISYFNFFPTASEFTIPGGQYYSLISTFSSRRSCTHHGYLRISSLGFTGGSLDLPYSVVSKF